MISLFGTTIAAASPWMLLGIPCAIGLLVYVFRVRGTAQQAVVSSLLFLQELPRRPIGRKVFVPPLQFWLELAILTLLLLATAGLFFTHAGKHVAVVIDSSLSMGALYGSGGTRLEHAKRIAALDINRAPDSTAYSVFSSASDLSPLSAPDDASSEATTAIQSAPQSHRADSLQEHLASLLADPSYDAVWVYTDRELQNTPPSSRLIVNQLPIEPATQTNAWIKGVERINDGSLAVLIGYGGASKREALVDGDCYNADSKKPLKISPQKVVLTPHEQSTTQLTPPTSTWAYCRVHVRLQDASLFDSLPLDNEGWIARKSSSPSIRVVSSLTPQQLGLSHIPHTSFATDPTDASQKLPTIFHRQLPSREPSTSSLVVLPPAGPLPWGGSVSQRAPQARDITRWDSSHPLLAYLNPSLVSLTEVHPLECPTTATPILFSNAGPIACAGEDKGARYLITGFELFPFDGNKNPTISIFTLNAFKWLFQSSATTSAGSLPSKLPVAETVTNVEYLQPTSSTLDVTGGNISPRHPGILLLDHTDGAQDHIALNAFEESESNLSQRTTLSVSQQSSLATQTSKASSTQPLAHWLTSFALLVVAGDILRRILRRARWGDA